MCAELSAASTGTLPAHGTTLSTSLRKDQLWLKCQVLSRVFAVAFEAYVAEFSGKPHAEHSYFREVSTRKRPLANLAFDLAPLAESGLYLSALHLIPHFLHDPSSTRPRCREDPVHRLSPGGGEDLSVTPPTRKRAGFPDRRLCSVTGDQPGPVADVRRASRRTATRSPMAGRRYFAQHVPCSPKAYPSPENRPAFLAPTTRRICVHLLHVKSAVPETSHVRVKRPSRLRTGQLSGAFDSATG
jgi:hypothetical protein